MTDVKLAACAARLVRYANGDVRRLACMLYLTDWKSSIEHGHQITQRRWQINGHGPYTDDLEKALSGMTIKTGAIARIRQALLFDGLTPDERAVIYHVIDQTAGLDRIGFHRLLVSTWPCITQPRRSPSSDLPAIAREYTEAWSA